MNAEKVLVGALAGFAAGALVGILFAPDKGSNTRKKIMNKRDDLSDALREKFDSFVDSVTSSIDEVRDDAENLADDAKNFMRNKGSEAKRELKNSM